MKRNFSFILVRGIADYYEEAEMRIVASRIRKVFNVP